MSQKVWNGFWIDWELGRVAGANLTLPQYQGLVLVSFLTLFVQFAGGCLWRVICFAMHQVRSTTAARDGLFHQQQATLRNSITAPNALWNLMRMAYAWRQRANSPFRKSIGLILITGFHIAVFGAAGLFSSQIANIAAGQALVRSDVCGFPAEVDGLGNIEVFDLSGEQLEALNTEALLGRQTFQRSQAYVRSCYNEDSSSSATTCNFYVKSHLAGVNASTIKNATCPFSSNACGSTAAVRFDSGLIRSNEDLGINSRDEESLFIRKVSTCAPVLGEEKYSTPWRDDVPEPYTGTNTSAKYYEFGKSVVDGCEGTNITTNLTTFCITQYQKATIRAAYTLRAVTAYHNNTNASGFSPIQDFEANSRDVTLVSLLNKAYYSGESLDPVFNASQPTTNSQFFMASNNLSFYGCTEQYMFCNSRDKCTDLTGLYGVKQSIDNGDLGLNSRENATYRLMWKSAWAMAFQWAFALLNEDVLLARDWVISTSSLASSPLLPNQWQVEAENLHNLSLAVFQHRINEYASPINFEIRPNVSSHSRIEPPTDPEMRALCDSQKIRSANHYSVNVLGMAIILGVGSLFIILDWVLINQIFWFRAVTHHRMAKKADWASTGTLMLQKQALESRGIGPWETKNYGFPTLTKRFHDFEGLGTQSEVSMPLNEGAWSSTAYQGGRYSEPPTPYQEQPEAGIIISGTGKGDRKI
ncbi:hypothetical protein EJ04DRAFT_151116 [Polyplosphaeria fusca]|uniref:Uncharacterized protein n=1 Tax=Polyplosphaeria fusca TaxID=682080 RepID=A0A9P4R188_9PLEO|nr:hypothetical protein EJ04DRAFT_151116 [Polyplosphaeria fusca]